MATKIITKNSSTASAAPLAADLSAGELAINTNDGKLFYKDSGGTVRTLASKDAASGSFATLSASGNATVGGTLGVTGATTLSSTLAVTGTTTLTGAATLTANPTLSAGTANGVLYLDGSKVATSGSALTFDGASLASTAAWATGKGQIYTDASSGNLSGIANRYNGVEKGYLYYDNTSSTYNLYGGTGVSLVFSANLAEKMRLTSTGLGIGTSSPSTKLDIYDASSPRVAVSGPSTATGYLVFRNTTSGVNRGYVGYEFANDAILFATAGSERMRLDSSGNLGLGVTPSAWSANYKPIQLGQYASVAAEISTVGQALFANNVYATGTGSSPTYNRVAGSSASMYLLDANVHKWFTAGTGTAGSAITFTQAMTLDASGNLGVGSTSPVAKLDVNGSAVLRIASATESRTLGFVTSNGVYGWTIGNGVTASADQFVIYSNTAGAARMLIDSSGNLLVGTTSQSGKLAVSGAATSAPLVTFNSSTAGDVGQPGLRIGKQDNNTTTSQIILQATILSTGAGAGQINMNGANTLAFGTYSDARLKENIVDIPPQLANIMALRPVEFDYIASEGGGHQTGFIAQEMQKVYPDAVGEREDGMLTVSAWSKTEARLVKAIQEQQAIIEQLKADVAALKGA